MHDYILLITENERARTTPAELAGHLDARAAYLARLAAAGALADEGRLRPSAEGARVRASGAVAEGPFDDALAAYVALRAPDLDAAVALAADYPLAPGDALEVRPIMGGHFAADKLDQPGKLFAFPVLGTARDEPTWTQLMDRIDEETRDRFPQDGFLGGARLEAPSRGRRVTFERGKRHVIDGPFLESKEVIGGLFVMRMASRDEALRWAATTRFVAHGSLEVRELWRA